MDTKLTYTAFAGTALVGSGDLAAILACCHGAQESGRDGVLVFSDESGKQVDFDLHGSLDEVLARHGLSGEGPKRGPGRPKLGVKGMEVTLLPRHWDWLERQPQGVSATLRRLVDEARGRETESDRERERMDAAFRFMSAMAGDLPGYEEACRALYRRDRAVFGALVGLWPADIRDHALRLLG